MIEKTKDLAWKEEIPQQFTSAEMTEIKNAISQEPVNVNVRPYHIYSPNEQVVGEWRQIVDGVLKKKPVYEKRNTYTSIGNGQTSLETISSEIELRDIDFSVFMFSDRINIAKCPYYQNQTYNMYADVDNGTLRFVNNWTGVTLSKVEATLRYTKTTDQWETVE